MAERKKPRDTQNGHSLGYVSMVVVTTPQRKQHKERISLAYGSRGLMVRDVREEVAGSR